MTRSSSDDVDAVVAVADATFDTWYRREYHSVVSLIHVLSGSRWAAEARADAKHLGRTRDLPAELPASADAFWSAVRSLPERQAQIVALHHHDDRPVDDIAGLLGISPGTVKTQLHRARKSLTSRLELDDSSDEPVAPTPADSQEQA